MSELVGTVVLVVAGADVVGRACGRAHREGRACPHCGAAYRVVGSATDHTTEQQRVVVEGPGRGVFRSYSLKDFSTFFESADRPPAEKAIVHKEGSGF